MDWFHCNQCFKKSGSKFAVSSCGHICCEGCIKSNQCCICGASCSYLPITDGMKTPEKVFFMDPVKLLQSTIAKISQVAVFQQKQMERVIYHFKNKSSELERRLREVSDQGHRQLSEVKKENAELKKQLLELRRETADLRKPLSQRRISPGQFQSNGAQRVSLPVAVTSPVTPRSRTTSLVGSAESQRWNRDRGISLTVCIQRLLDPLPPCPATARFMNTGHRDLWALLRGAPVIDLDQGTLLGHHFPYIVMDKFPTGIRFIVMNPDPCFPVPICIWTHTPIPQAVINGSIFEEHRPLVGDLFI